MLFPTKTDKVKKVTFEIYQSQTRSIELDGSWPSSRRTDPAMVPNDIVRPNMYAKNKKSQNGTTLVFEQKKIFFMTPLFWKKL